MKARPFIKRREREYVYYKYSSHIFRSKNNDTWEYFDWSDSRQWRGTWYGTALITEGKEITTKEVIDTYPNVPI